MIHHPDLTPSEVTQLQQLKLVGDDPERACMWRGPECARLTELGDARQDEHLAGIWHVTPEGRAALARLEA